MENNNDYIIIWERGEEVYQVCHKFIALSILDKLPLETGHYTFEYVTKERALELDKLQKDGLHYFTENLQYPSHLEDVEASLNDLAQKCRTLRLRSGLVDRDRIRKMNAGGYCFDELDRQLKSIQKEFKRMEGINYE